MNEKMIDQSEHTPLGYDFGDALEAAGTRTEIAAAWTFVCVVPAPGLIHLVRE